MSISPVISVVIPTLRRPLLVRDLLGSLERQICRAPFEVIVVSNLPERGLRKTVESFGRNFRYFETGRLGVNIARNKGLDKARGSLILLLDDDCYLQSRDFLQRHLDLHESHPDAVAIGGRFALKAGARRLETAYHWILDHSLTSACLDDGKTLFLSGGNCSFKKKLVGRLLHFNETRVFGRSEAELFSRLTREGYVLRLFDELTVEHRLSLRRSDLIKRAYLQGYTSGAMEAASLMPRKKHWNATLTLEQNMRKAGVEPDTKHLGVFALYRRFFSFGKTMGRKSDKRKAPIPPLSMLDYFAERARNWRRIEWPRLLDTAYHSLNGGIETGQRLIARKPRSSRRGSSLSSQASSSGPADSPRP